MAKDTNRTPPTSEPQGVTPFATPAASPLAGEPNVTTTETVVTEVTGAPLVAPAATVEEVHVNKDPAGVPRSASIDGGRAIGVDGVGRTILPRATRATASVFVGTTLPAKTRVLASGISVPANPRNEDLGEERRFTAKSRTLRSGTIYEIGAPIPLTRSEFEVKRASDAVVEKVFDDGDDLPEDLLFDGRLPAP